MTVIHCGAMTPEQYAKQDKLVRDLARTNWNLTEYGRERFAVDAEPEMYRALWALSYHAQKTDGASIPDRALFITQG
jgi:hypothetical protein